MISFDILRKESMEEILKYNILDIVIFFTVGIYLVRENISSIYAVFILAILSTYLYISCILYKEFKQHLNIHYHDKNKQENFIKILFESILSTIPLIAIYIIQIITKINTFPNELLFYIGFIVLIINFVNITLLGRIHKKITDDLILKNTGFILPNILFSYFITRYIFYGNFL